MYVDIYLYIYILYISICWCMLFNVPDVKKDIILGQKLPEIQGSTHPMISGQFFGNLFFSNGNPPNWRSTSGFGIWRKLSDTGYLLWHIFFWLTKNCCIGNRWLLTLNWCNEEKQEKSWKDMGVVQQVRLPTTAYVSWDREPSSEHVVFRPVFTVKNMWTLHLGRYAAWKDAIVNTRIMTWDF